MAKNKVIYFFRGNLNSHVGLYKSWVDLVKNDLNITMLTFMSPSIYKEQHTLVKKYRDEGIKIYSVFDWFNRFAVLLYFIFQCVKYKKVTVHLRKQPIKIFNLIRKITFGRLKYIIEIEGDFKSEIDYLSNPMNEYKNGFYDSMIMGMKENSHLLEYELKSADGILVPTNEMKKLFIKRYNLSDEGKFSVLPTVFDKNKFFYDNNLREETRKKLNVEDKTVMIFAGNVYYSWQNIKRSLQVFQLLKQHDKFDNLHFIILTRVIDYPIVEDFASKLGVSRDDYTLMNVPHDVVNSILNASDIGILLRDDHQLNKIVSTGKLGEYLAAGLTVITSNYIGLYSAQMKDSAVGVLLDDIYSDSEVVDKTAELILSDEKRLVVSHWALKNFCVDTYKNEYLKALKSS